MKVGLLFSGGKDSTYAGFLAKKSGNEIVCLISIVSKNKFSYMFHTPSISETKKQAREMQIPIIIQKTKGEKEEELKDLENAIKIAIEKYKIEGIVTGALYSDYQFSRIKKICEKLKIKCVNPLWHKDEIEYLNELIKNNFKIVITGVFAYPLDKNWLGRIIDEKFVKDAVELEEKYKIHAAGEGGEFETFVIDCPLFKNELKIKSFRDFKEGENSWRRELKIQ